METTQPVGALSGSLPPDISGADKQGAAAAQQKSRRTANELTAAVQELNAAMKVVNTNLSFSIDSITKQTVVTVTDAHTHEIIRQIPSEEVLKVSDRIAKLLGVLFDHEG